MVECSKRKGMVVIIRVLSDGVFIGRQDGNNCIVISPNISRSIVNDTICIRTNKIKYHNIFVGGLNYDGGNDRDNFQSLYAFSVDERKSVIYCVGEYDGKEYEVHCFDSNYLRYVKSEIDRNALYVIVTEYPIRKR